MFWHVFWYAVWMVGGGVVLDIGRAYLLGRARQRGFRLARDGEARRLERERELAPFLPEAQREVDAMFWATTALGRPEAPKILSPAAVPVPDLPANVAERPNYAVVDAIRWIALTNIELVDSYWSARRAGDLGQINSIRVELEHRYGPRVVAKADERWVEVNQPPSDPDDDPVVIDGKTLPAPNDKRWALSAGGEGILFWMREAGKVLFVYPDGDVRLSDHGTWFKHKAAAALCKKVAARLRPAAQKVASDALAAAIKNVEAAAGKKKV